MEVRVRVSGSEEWRGRVRILEFSSTVQLIGK